VEGNCGQIGVGCWEMRVYLSFTSYFVYLFSITSKSGCVTMILISLSGVLAYTKKRVLRMDSGGGTDSFFAILILSF